MFAISNIGTGVLGRLAFGMRTSICDDSGHERFHVRIGGTGHAQGFHIGIGSTSDDMSTIQQAGGFEVEVGPSLAALRVGAEWNNGYLVTVGGRHRAGALVVAVDVFHGTGTRLASSTVVKESSLGVMFGAGLDGHLGVWGSLAAAAGLGLVSLVALSFNPH